MTLKGKFNLWRWQNPVAPVILILTMALAANAPVAFGTDSAGGKDAPLGHSAASSNILEFMGSWIWEAKTLGVQVCQFWRAFELPATSQVINARLLVTADNEFTVFLDGRELGRGAEWRGLFSYNLTLLMSAGRHVLAVKAINSSSSAGMLLGLRIELADGQSIEIKSDPSWRIAPETAKGWKGMTRAPDTWPTATVVAALGNLPWWTQPMQVNVMPTPQPIKVFFWQTAWFQVTFLLVCGLIVLSIFFLAAQLALHQKEHWLLQRERARIAMDVHDDLGSRMTHLVLTGEVVQGDLPADSKARAQLEQICDEARGVLSSIDEILWALNPRRDTLQDFADYVCDYAQKFLGPAGVECVFEVVPETLDAAADLPLRRSLLMAIKETLNNTVKYSGATEVRLHIGRQRHNLVVVVEDNGRGFDLASIQPGRNGLGNMSRRMRELGGNCRIASQSGKGCRIEFCIPLRRPRQLSWARIRGRQRRAAPANESPNPQVGETLNLK